MYNISVIIPVYNDGNYLKEAIDSILNQTLDDIEIVCVNDGSTDNSLEILKEYEKKYDFIKVFSQTNQGVSIARNKAMSESSGKYLAFLDADDIFIDKRALEKLFDVAEKNNSNMVSGNLKLLKNGKIQKFNNLVEYTEEEIILPEDYGIPFSFTKSIFNREFLKSNDIWFPKLTKGEDPVFLAEVFSKLDKIYAVPVDVYAYRYLDGSVKYDSYQNYLDQITQYKMVFDYLKDDKFNKTCHEFRHKLIGFIDWIGIDGAENTIKAIKDVFKDDPKILRDCEEYFYFKYKNNPELSSLVHLDKNNEKPRVSVVIPVYNVSEFLHEAISSLLNQTLDDIELICVNDGSTDNSLEILNEFASKDSRVKVIDKPNGGCGSARNRALDEANGEFIYFFDPDDRVIPNALEELYMNAISNDSDLVLFKIAKFMDGEPIDYSTPFFNFDKKFKNVDFYHFTFNYQDIKKHVLNSAFAPWSKLYRKSFIDQYDDFRFDLGVAFDDVPFHVKSLLRAEYLSFVPEYYYHYRYANPNSVNNTSSNGKDIMEIVDIVESFLRKNNYFNEFSEEFYHFKVNQIKMYIISSNSEEYFELAKEKLLAIPYENLTHLPRYLLDTYGYIINAESFKHCKALIIYEDALQEFKVLTINNKKIEKRNKKLTKKQKKLKSQNKQLKKDLKKSKKLKNEILNSKSWKLTEIFRKIRFKV